MREVAKTSAFKQCIKLLNRRHWDLALLADTIGKLQRDAPSSRLFKDHPLVGPFAGKRECHVTSISDNWVLVYQKVGDDRLILHGTGTHADVFG